MEYKLTVSDKTGLADSPLEIDISTPIPFQEVSVKLNVSDYYCINAPLNCSTKTKWMSEATFVTDNKGNISVSKSPSIRGDYLGVNGMGLFESLHYSKMISSKRCLSLEDLPLYDYFNAEISLWIKEKKVAETTVKRYFKYPNIEYKNIVNANWLGRIFYRNTEDKAPCIIVLSGSDGGLEKSQNIAMLLASRGYVSLAMSYFGMDGQTPYLDQIPLENIQEALQILSENTHVDPNRIGIYGRSKGAEYALASISKFHEFKSAVLNAPSNQVYEGLRGKMNSHHSSWTFKNQEVPYTKFSILKLLQSKVLPQHPAKAPDSLIDVHDSGTNILLIASTKDEVWDSKNSALQIAKTIPAENCSIYFTTHLGHMNTISYQPNLRYGLKDLKSLHDEVKESWSKTILHFNKTL